MENLLYYSNGKCKCGGRLFVSAVYILPGAMNAPHLIIEEACRSCEKFDLVDIDIESEIGRIMTWFNEQPDFDDGSDESWDDDWQNETERR